MDRRLIFEQNLDTILRCLNSEANGLSLNRLQFIGLAGNITLLLSQLRADYYITISESEQLIQITPRGKNFLYKKGGYVQAKIDTIAKVNKVRKPFGGILKALEESISLLFLFVFLFSATIMLCTCLFIFECYKSLAR